MPLAVLGVDLASGRWQDNGTALVTFEPEGSWLAVECGAVPWPSIGKPSAEALADGIDVYARRTGVSAVSIDGPQGWRDPNGHGWGREADRAARTPGKMGPPKTCVPGTYLPWVSLSVELFATLAAHRHVHLANEPVERLPPPEAGTYYLLESFPTSTWRSAGLVPMPGKGKRPDTSTYAQELSRAFGLPSMGPTGHDDLQAVVAALPAAALLGGQACTLPRGRSGYHVGADWVEGIIWDAVPVGGPTTPALPDTRPLLVLVTGPPGGGKTTLAGPLARELGLPLVARDELKEILYDDLGTGDVDWTRRLGGASFALVFLVAGRLLEAGTSLVLEANFFRGSSEADVDRLPPHRLVQVHCSAPAEVLLSRLTTRTDRHRGHLDDRRVEEVAERVRDGAHEPLDLPGQVLRVDTANSVDMRELARRVRTRN